MRTAESAKYNRMMSVKLERSLPPLRHQRRKVQCESSDESSDESNDESSDESSDLELVEASRQSSEDSGSDDEDAKELIDHSESSEQGESVLPVINQPPKISVNMRWSNTKRMYVEVIDLC